MKNLLLAVTLAGLTAAAGLAQAPAKPARPEDKPAPTLKVGDAAPALKATKWLQGDEVKKFEPGKVYVVEFWATWCGPCIVMMPHLADMQAEFKDKGVTLIGYSAKDPNNSEEKVAEFVKKRGPKLKYTFAYADDRSAYDAWMKAAGRNGIPCSFVVDKAGKIAYIGHPMYLDVVLPKVVDGTWKVKEGADELAGVEKEVNAVFLSFRANDAEASLKAIQDFEKKHPALSKIPYFVSPKIAALVKAKKTDEAKKFAEEVIAKAIKQDDPTGLQMVGGATRSPDARANKELMALSVKAAEALLKLSGDKDWQALYNMADTHFAAGDKAKAKEFGQKAMGAADNENVKRFLEQRIKQFDAEPKNDK